MKRMFKKIYINAPITLCFVSLCVIALVINRVTLGAANELLFSTYNTSLLDPLFYLRLFLHIFGHADWTHLINNMLYILLLGPILEEKYGNKIIIVILFTALITGIAHNLLYSNVALLGASSICFSFILLASFTGKNEGIPITFILVAILWLGGEIINAFTADNVSQLGHIVGGLSGAIMAYFLKKR